MMSHRDRVHPHLPHTRDHTLMCVSIATAYATGVVVCQVSLLCDTILCRRRPPSPAITRCHRPCLSFHLPTITSTDPVPFVMLELCRMLGRRHFHILGPNEQD
jgi:hypothetical protein